MAELKLVINQNRDRDRTGGDSPRPARLTFALEPMEDDVMPPTSAVVASLCPFCGGDKCSHFAGWTSDGKVVDDRWGTAIRPDDRIVNTGVSARVYRDAAHV